MAVAPAILVFGDANLLAQAAARNIVERISRALEQRGVCSLALSGGETPRAVYRLLATSEYNVQADWTRVHFFFGDERLVPPDDPESNFGMARSELLSRLPVPAGNINRVRGELPAGEAVADYRRRLEEFFGSGPVRFDLVMLGLGKDGHTASLFPGSDAIAESDASVVAVFAAGVKTQRATLTLPVINNARDIMFLVSGRGKAPVVRDIMRADRPTPKLPATLVSPLDGELEWMLDSDAASLMKDNR
jgi:6-phosphogluconolactonase